MFKPGKPGRKRSISANENIRFLIALKPERWHEHYPVACSGVRQRNFDFIHRMVNPIGKVSSL
jgi:hypothetical protein